MRGIESSAHQMNTQQFLGPRSSTTEKMRTRILLGDFVAEGSKGLDFLKKIYPHPLSRSVLISLATVFSGLTNVPFDRDFRRKKELVIKWFDEHLDECKKWNSHVRFEYTEYKEFLKQDPKSSKNKNKKKSKKWDSDDFALDYSDE